MSEVTEQALQAVPAVTPPMLVVQLPIIQERLQDIRQAVTERTNQAKSLVCSPETLRDVKQARAELRAEFDSLEDQRKAVKKAVMEPYEQFERTYRECVSDAFTEADSALKGKIASVESGIKSQCENRLYAWFEELKELNHLDFLRWDQVGVKVDMASAQQKTPKKLMAQIEGFVQRVREDVTMISGMENAEEIMVEYKKTLNAPGAVHTVQERHSAIAREAEARAMRVDSTRQEEEHARQIEEAVRKGGKAMVPLEAAPAAPVSEEQEQKYRCTFSVVATKAQLKKLKEFMNQEGIQYYA